jgi:hypothetical protein
MLARESGPIGIALSMAKRGTMIPNSHSNVTSRIDITLTDKVMVGGERERGVTVVTMNEIMNKKLTDKQTLLVDTLVASGCSVTQAAKEAGYAKGDSGRVSASRALRQPHVQQYMMQRVSDQLGLNATVAVAKVLKLASGARSEYVQLEASKDILDRAGFKPIDRSQVQVAGDIKVAIDLS